jgi:hypothetical protein
MESAESPLSDAGPECGAAKAVTVLRCVAALPKRFARPQDRPRLVEWLRFRSGEPWRWLVFRPSPATYRPAGRGAAGSRARKSPFGYRER